MCETFLIQRELNEILSCRQIGPYARYPLSRQTSINLEFSRQIFEKKKSSEISNFIKFHTARAELFRVGGRTDMTKLWWGYLRENFPSDGIRSPDRPARSIVAMPD